MVWKNLGEISHAFEYYYRMDKVKQLSFVIKIQVRIYNNFISFENISNISTLRIKIEYNRKQYFYQYFYQNDPTMTCLISFLKISKHVLRTQSVKS